jgi:hypothetical protein
MLLSKLYFISFCEFLFSTFIFQGEYDQSWVPVGEKLVDYGGHDEAAAVPAAVVRPLVTDGGKALATKDSALVDEMNQKIKKRARRDARNKAAGKIADEHSEAASREIGTPTGAGTAQS